MGNNRADKTNSKAASKSKDSKSFTATSASGHFSQEQFGDILAAMYDNPNGPVKILTPVDFQLKRKYMGVYLGIPLFVDPLVGKDEVWVEYRNGRKERLPRTTVNDLATIYPEDTTEHLKSAQLTEATQERKDTEE